LIHFRGRELRPRFFINFSKAAENPFAVSFISRRKAKRKDHYMSLFNRNLERFLIRNLTMRSQEKVMEIFYYNFYSIINKT